MAATRRNTANKSKTETISVVFDMMEPKRHSVRFKTEADNVPFSNIYITNAAHAQLGSPGKLKVTIESSE